MGKRLPKKTKTNVRMAGGALPNLAPLRIPRVAPFPRSLDRELATQEKSQIREAWRLAATLATSIQIAAEIFGCIPLQWVVSAEYQKAISDVAREFDNAETILAVFAGATRTGNIYEFSRGNGPTAFEVFGFFARMLDLIQSYRNGLESRGLNVSRFTNWHAIEECSSGLIFGGVAERGDNNFFLQEDASGRFEVALPVAKQVLQGLEVDPRLTLDLNSPDQETPAAALPDATRTLKINPEQGNVQFRGLVHPLDRPLVEILHILNLQPGVPVTGPEMREKSEILKHYPRLDRLVKKVPAPFRSMINSRRGRGYWLEVP